MDWHALTAQETVLSQETDTKEGLSANEITKRRRIFGWNVLATQKKTPFILRFLAQLKDFMILTLLAAAVISLLASYCKHEVDFVEPCIILGIVLLNAILGLVQESKAEHALEALRDMVAPMATVIRAGKTSVIEAKALVPGDIILLETGCFVPADARLIETTLLQADESSLTGESHPVNKNAGLHLPAQTPLADQKNMVFSSTLVVAGHGKAVVTATGMDTEVGKIASLMMQDEIPMTPLQKRLAKTGQLLGIGALAICVIIFLVGVAGGSPIFDMFMTSVSLAVAAIPEGLPATVTIMLSLGVQRMAKKNAVVRRLPVVETLGSATFICSDKTGTLTANQMTVTRIEPETSRKLLLTLCCLCNNAAIDGKTVTGSPTETALLTAARKAGLNRADLEKKYPRKAELPFDSVRKRMSTVHSIGPGRYRIITKGAVDFLMDLCSLSSFEKREILRQNQSMAGDALRVLAVGFRDFEGPLPSDLASLEKGLQFAGLIGIIDPPRPEVFQSIQLCKQAGIVPVMITGDHKDTAVAIARELGILHNKEQAITGKELSAMAPEQLRETIKNYRVFARVSPENKVQIVKALQQRGEIVAMTGDGINDAPALRGADIGCAMGKNGTDVAKNAADMVLLDDNFSTIVAAVKEGRGIYDNIQKAVHFLLSSNIGEIITIFTAILMGLPSPLVAVQLLWVNLVTDSLPAVALGVDPPDKDIMKRPPVAPGQSFFSGGLYYKIVLEGIMIGALALGSFYLGCKESLPLGRTMCFAVLSLSQLFHSFNMRSRKSIFKAGLFTNPKLVLSFFVCTLLQVSVISIPVLAAVFQVIPLTLHQWGLVWIFSAMPIFIVETVKRLKGK
ncbi:calcium-translocating P-type ATPase, PMCA-type [Anaerolentibacter hominis]|uniref:calcium-translocating P-type ATPase, PMCA-type n=1 Tax=Anaerolentibacter hominis TaxID=3079009 RepID=UPI0031B7FCFC